MTGTPTYLGSQPLLAERGVCGEVDSWSPGSTALNLGVGTETRLFVFP